MAEKNVLMKETNRYTKRAVASSMHRIAFNISPVKVRVKGPALDVSDLERIQKNTFGDFFVATEPN